MIEIKSLSDALKVQEEFAVRAKKELSAVRGNALQTLRKLGVQQVSEALEQAKAALAAAEADRREGIKMLEERVVRCQKEVERLQAQQASTKDAGVAVEPEITETAEPAVPEKRPRTTAKKK